MLAVKCGKEFDISDYLPIRDSGEQNLVVISTRLVVKMYTEGLITYFNNTNKANWILCIVDNLTRSQ